MSEQLLLFSIGDHSLAVAVKHVREVVRAVALSPPSVASIRVEGLLDLRGQTIPVADIRHALKIAPSEIELQHRLIVLSADGQSVAVRADENPHLHDVESSSIEAREPDSLTPHVVHFDGRLLHLLDPARLVTFMKCDSLSFPSPSSDEGT